jgi:DDE superfamily endonuclease
MPVEGATVAEVFRTDVKRVLGPTRRPGDMVVMDNLRAHKAVGVQQALARRGARLLYLSPYSPDLSPIELCWSKVKTALQQPKADMPAAPRRPANETPPLVVRSVALTPAAQATLEALIAQASVAIGRKASASAVVWALLAWAEHEHLGAELVHLIAAELQTGEVVWGKARTRR